MFVHFFSYFIVKTSVTIAMQEFYSFIRKESNYASYVAFYNLFDISYVH